MTIMQLKISAKNKPAVGVAPGSGLRRMAVGEFKAKCLGVMAEVAKTGKPLLVTKRGTPFVEVRPPRHGTKDKRRSFIGRLEGKYEICGDLLEPIFPLEDYDMLK
jgi:prevent-host-death family protein